MANLEKHPKKVIQEWLDAEESPVPTRSRSPHVIGEYTKNRRRYEGRYWPRFVQDAGEFLVRLSEEGTPVSPAPRRKSPMPPPLRHREMQDRLRLPFGMKRVR